MNTITRIALTALLAILTATQVSAQFHTVYWKASLIVLFKLHHVDYLQEIVIMQAHCV